MIENVYPIKDNKAIGVTGRSRKLPRNIRACGHGGGPFPVYIEDYVGTYIRRLAESGFPECSAVVLVGQVMETEVGRCLFVRGAVNANKICVGDKPVFGEAVWNEVYEKIRLYFPEDEVVGWCVAGPGFRLLQEDIFLRVHIDNFADSEKVFMCYESLEKELALRICIGGGFCVLPGYYVYYEKNDEMQNYMLEEAPVERKEAKTVQEPLDVSQPEEKKKESKKDILQLAAIACIIVLIVSVMMGTDTLSLLKESAFAETENEQEEEVAFEENLSTEEAEKFAFGDFDFLDTTEPDEEKEAEQEREEQEKESEDVKEEEKDDEKDDEESDNAFEEQIAKEPAGEPEQVAEADVSQPEKKEDDTEETENPDKIEEETVTVLSPSEYTSYIVKPGDTLAGICMEIYGSVELLHYVCELNQLKNIDSIYAGQELIFPK